MTVFTFETVHAVADPGPAEWGGRILLPVALLAVVLALVSGIGQVGFAVTPGSAASEVGAAEPGHRASSVCCRCAGRWKCSKASAEDEPGCRHLLLGILRGGD